MPDIEYALISPQALKRFIPRSYNLPMTSEIVLIHQGFHDTYLITTLTTKYILRVFRSGWKSYNQVSAELELLAMLKHRGIHVSFPIGDIENTMIQPLDSP